jgi:hypothetical protein
MIRLGENTMSDFYFSVNIDAERVLCVAPLTDRRISMSGERLQDSSGYFLYEQHGSGEGASIEIIAKVLTEDAALRLRDMFQMS